MRAMMRARLYMIEIICWGPRLIVTPTSVPASVRDLASHRSIPKGESIFRVGAPAGRVFFLQRGRVVLHRFGPAGEEVVIHIADAGEYL